MFGDTLGWIFGALLLLVLIAYVLDFLGLLDFLEVLAGLAKLVMAVIAMIAALFFWSARKLIAVAMTPAKSDIPSNPDPGLAPNSGPSPVPDARPSIGRGRIVTRSMARQRGQK